jgi:hypothetical protein
MILPVAAMVGAAVSSTTASAKEQKEEEVSKGTENLEAINENQELAESVTDLTEEYSALRDAGESTAEVLESMKDKVPDLIASYKELAKTLGTHIDVSSLEDAYNTFLATGNIDSFTQAQENIDNQIKEIEKTTARNTAILASELAIGAATEDNDGKVDSQGKYRVSIGDHSDSGKNIGGKSDAEVGQEYFKKYLGEYWNAEDS